MKAARERPKQSLQLLERQLQHEQAFLLLAQELLEQTNRRIVALTAEKQQIIDSQPRESD